MLGLASSLLGGGGGGGGLLGSSGVTDSGSAISGATVNGSISSAFNVGTSDKSWVGYVVLGVVAFVLLKRRGR